MAVNLSAEKEVPVLNGFSPIKGRRFLSRLSTSESDWKHEMSNNDQSRPGRNIDQAGRQLGGGKPINTGPHSLLNNSQQSTYLPSFSDKSQTKNKRTKKLSTVSTYLIPVELKRALPPTRRRHSNTDVYVPSQTLKAQNTTKEFSFPLSPNMKKVTQNNRVRKSSSLGLSTGPVTSSLQLDTRRPSRSVNFQTDTRTYTQHKAPGGSQGTSLNKELLINNFPSPFNRPTAPLRSQETKEINHHETSSVNQGPLNTLSLDNWLSSLPDSKPNMESTGSISELSERSPDLELKEIEDFDEESGCIGRASSAFVNYRKGEPISLCGKGSEKCDVRRNRLLIFCWMDWPSIYFQF